MTINVLGAASFLIERSNCTLSNLELQKIIYIAHMFHLGRYDKKPLVHGQFQAWYYGPVHPDLYHQVKLYGANPVKMVYRAPNIDKSNNEARLLEKAYEALGNAGPGVLVNVTHKANGAWDKNYVAGVRGVPIPNEDIWQEYQEFDYK